MASLPVPSVGDKVYVDHCDVTNGAYLHGGIATVSDVRYEGETPWIEVVETEEQWRWDYLSELQGELRERFGDSVAGQFTFGPARPKNSN